MTWNPRKKNVLTLRPTSAPPLISVNDDRDLDITVQRLIHVEGTIRKLMKEAKRYVGAISNLDRADQRLSFNLSTSGLAHLSDDFRRIVEDYHSVTTQVGKTVPDISVLMNKTFIDPLKKLSSEFSLIADALAKREELVATWRISHTRMKKLQERKDKTASHIAKLERERRNEEASAKELTSIHSQLLQEFPWFLEKRLDYIKPSLHALIFNQLDYYGNTTKLFTQLMPHPRFSGSPSPTTIADEEYHRKIDGEMAKIRGLTIVKP